jgi:segregation and condensation protein A
MGFEEFLPESEEDEDEDADFKVAVAEDKIGPNQVYDVITSKKHDWYDIIYELINSEQLDPWDIDIVVLTRRYFEKIAELEEADFYISSKVLLAAALLLRIKSEFLLNKHIKDIDEVLFGRKEEQKSVFERMSINDDDLPILIPKTPMERLKKVTLQELMAALNHAINTESRRIKREVAVKNAKRLSEVDFPKFQRIDLKDRIKQFYAKLLTVIKKKTNGDEKHLNKVSYSNLTGIEREEKLACFLPLLHLSNTKKLWLEQGGHLEEIWIYLYEYFDKNRDKFIEELQNDVDEINEELKNIVNEEGGENLDVLAEELEKAEAMKKIVEEIKQEEVDKIEDEIKEIEKEEKIDEVSGFDENNLS